MRMRQLYCVSFSHFADAIAKKYGFKNCNLSRNINEPLFIFGCYGEKDLYTAILQSSQGQIVIICWAGSDILNIVNNPPQNKKILFNEIKSRKNIKHIAISSFIAHDLDLLGVPYYRIPITPHDFNDIKPEPLGDSIYMYQPDSETYNGGIYSALKETLPYNFIEAKFGDYTRKEMMVIYKKCFIGLRFTKHDGLSNAVCEMGMMGRMVINNGDTPNSIHFEKNNLNKIIENIRLVYEDRISATEKYIAQQMRDYLNIGEDFLETEYYVSHV